MLARAKGAQQRSSSEAIVDHQIKSDFAGARRGSHQIRCWFSDRIGLGDGRNLQKSIEMGVVLPIEALGPLGMGLKRCNGTVSA